MHFLKENNRGLKNNSKMGEKDSAISNDREHGLEGLPKPRRLEFIRSIHPRTESFNVFFRLSRRAYDC